MKRGKPPQRKARLQQRKAADPDRARRQRVKQQALDALDQLQGRQRSGVTPGTLDALAAAGLQPDAVQQLLDRQPVLVQVAEGPLVTVRLVPAHRGPRAPMKAQVQAPPRPRAMRVQAPSWLSLVRMMPCSFCPPGRHRPFRDQLQLGVPQSEANHHPSRGTAAGGSDLEVHPACRDCHRAITEHRALPDGTLVDQGRLDRAVADALHLGVQAIREGRVQPGIMLATGLEMLLGQGA